MAFTYSKLAEVTVGVSGAATIDFNNIPQNYKDLVIKLSVRSNRASSTWDNTQFKINGSTSNMSGRLLRGNGSSASSVTLSSFYIGDIPASSATVNTFASQEVYIPNYSVSGTQKSASVDSVGENNATDGRNDMLANLCSSVTVISQISIFSGNGDSFLQYSTATLYGVKAEV